mgnify:CR=1 FL=1
MPVQRSIISRSRARWLAVILLLLLVIGVIAFPGLLSGVSIRGFRPQYTGLAPRPAVTPTAASSTTRQRSGGTSSNSAARR